MRVAWPLFRRSIKRKTSVMVQMGKDSLHFDRACYNFERIFVYHPLTHLTYIVAVCAQRRSELHLPRAWLFTAFVGARNPTKVVHIQALDRCPGLLTVSEVDGVRLPLEQFLRPVVYNLLSSTKVRTRPPHTRLAHLPSHMSCTYSPPCAWYAAAGCRHRCRLRHVHRRLSARRRRRRPPPPST